MWLVGILGVGIGLIMGLTGAGGGILAVPLLTSGLSWPMQQAAPVALLAVSVGAWIGALDGFRLGLVRYKAAGLMAAAGIPMSGLGWLAAQQLPHLALQLLFSALLWVVGRRLLAQARHTPGSGDWETLRWALIHPDTGRFIWTVRTACLMVGIGGLTGFMSGLLGVGGGFFIVPMLKRFTALTMPGIVATSLFLIALVSAGAAGQVALQGLAWPPETLPFVVVVALGMLLGRRLARQVSAQLMQRAFAGLLLVVALGMLGSSLWSLGLQRV